MKQKDIALYIVIGIVSTVISVFLSKMIIVPEKNKTQEVEVVDAISSDFTTPASDSKYFNKDSVNPTKLIQIGDNDNSTPFNGSSN